jgi:putative hydrolase of the HAD superfamily
VIKSAIFDWFNTLAHYDPPREQVHAGALKEFGIIIDPVRLVNPLLTADSYFFDENIKKPIRTRNDAEQDRLYTRYEEIIMTEAGLKFEAGLPGKVFHKGKELFGDKLEFILFADVIPALKSLRERKLVIGLLTNFARDMVPLITRAGLAQYIDFVTTPYNAGADKPDPRIFYAALKQAAVTAEEAIYIGDQYKVDVVGAQSAGIKPLLIDRYNLYPDFKECPRITTVFEVADYIW